MSTSTPPSTTTTTTTTTTKTPFPSSSSSFRPFPLHNPSTPSSSPTPLSPPLPPTTKAAKPPELDHPSSTSSDGPTVEVAKRPRGRPPGSKNKPKPPPTPTSSLLPPPPSSSSSSSTSTPDFLRPHIFEIPTGHDVASSLSVFSRRRDVCLAVLAATGAVSNVTLRNPSSSLTFHGRFDLLSISATFLPPSFTPSSPTLLPSGVLSISLAGPQGRVVGGIVSGPLLAAGTVTIIAAAFSSPTFHRLPSDEDLSFSVSVSASGDGNTPTADADGTEDYPHRRSSDLPISTSSHLLSDVILRGQQTPPYP